MYNCVRIKKLVSKMQSDETNSLLLKMGGKLNNFTADNLGWIRPIRIHVAPECTNAYTDAQVPGRVI